jgi:hypothetical protein
MARMRHLRYFKSKEDYDKANENNELSWPRVCIWLNKNKEIEFEIKPLKETLIKVDNDTFLGCEDDVCIAI